MPSLEYKLHIFKAHQILHSISATPGQAPVTPWFYTTVLQQYYELEAKKEPPPPNFKVRCVILLFSLTAIFFRTKSPENF